MKRWIVILVVVGLVGYAVYDFTTNFAEEEKQIGLDKGDIAPNFELKTLEGETVKLSDYRGKKVMVNFWATWCPPCRAEMPDMQKFHEDEDAVILAVNLYDTEKSKKDVKNFLEDYGITFTVLSDYDSSIATLYNASALPTSYLINTKGEIHNIAMGALNYEQMVQVFNEMD